MTIGFHPLAGEFLADPYPTYRELRDLHPVLWHDELQSWIASRYDDCLEILRNSDVFRADPRTAGRDLPPPVASLQTLDGNEHAALQRILVRALKTIDPAMVGRQATRSLRNSLAEGADAKHVEFVQGIALPVTTDAAMSILGLPDEAALQVAEASSAIVRSMMHGLIPEGQQAGLQERILVTNLLDESLGSTREGLLGAIDADPEIATVNRGLLLNSVRVILLAAINSTQRFLSLSLHNLLTCEAGLQDFAAAQEKSRALNELTRFESSAQSAARFCVRPFEMHGQKFRSGDSVVALLGSANRDERRFLHADKLIFDRYDNPHLGFGRGAHACLGIQIAHAIGNAVFSFFATHFPQATPDGPRVVEPNPALRGLLSLPIKLH